MPKLFIHVIDCAFYFHDEGAEYDRPGDALQPAIDSAAALAVDEIHKGQTHAVIEVRVEEADGTALLRSVL